MHGGYWLQNLTETDHLNPRPRQDDNTKIFLQQDSGVDLIYLAQDWYDSLATVNTELNPFLFP